ncbi:tyrosine-type recombinase/integrase [Algoriphagus sp.]|uniref:tyrosine-type recombinase/integrase n=1 Tax=Algoriphagus sp. TaxID=1872435 RepID=UPI002604A5DE|nr:tyrosine-type recombinase/integrase [Algoriphagus sp.]
MRHNLGFKSGSSRFSLFAFDRFAREKGLRSITVTIELAEEWCAKRPGEAADTWSHRNCFLRQFSVYLSNLGHETFIPPRIPGPRDERFVPYIFSEAEIGAIYAACDRLTLYDRHARTHIMVLPALIRMLASTGIRIGEAVKLTNRDVNLEQNYLTLRSTKNGKDRLVPISGSLAAICVQYRKYRDLLPSNSDYFFVKLNGCGCQANGFSQWWNKILKMACIKHRGKTVGPRIQDLRHSFCIRALAHLLKEGKDLYYILPILSMYIGHTSLASTDRYVRMTSEMYPDLLDKTDSICSYIFSELNYRSTP